MGVLRSRLGAKFVLGLVLLSLVPLAVASLIGYLFFMGELRKSTVGTLAAVNHSRAAHINAFLAVRQEEAKVIAGSLTVRRLRPEGSNPPEVTRLVQAYVASVFEELQRRPRSPYKDIDRRSDIESISVWDILGTVVADTRPEFVGRRMPLEFLQILHDQGAYFKGMERDPLTGRKALTVLQGVRSLDGGEYAGVVFLRARAGVLDAITTDRRGLGRTAETYLVDEDGLMLTASRFDEKAVLRRKVKTPAVEACFSGRPVPPIYTSYLGRRVLGVAQYLPDPRWCLVTEMDASEAFRPVLLFRNRMVVLVALLALLILWTARSFGLRLVRPILELRDASLKVARGDYTVEAPMGSHDEVGEMARAFNQMTKILESTTRQLAEKNRVLERQKEELKKLDELKSEFVSMVSHELRTPLAIIKGSVEQLLAETPQDAGGDARELLEMALRSIHRLQNMINNLLDLSKIEAGRMELQKESCDLTALAGEVCRGFEGPAAKKGIAVRTRFSSSPIEACVDRDKIIQVFMNLVGNALKFVEKGSVEVRIDDGEETVVCAVADTGPGISQYDMDRVFKKFQQLGRRAGFGGSKGTGLGLSISKGLVELHGGRIWLESSLGKGTTFYFTLPKSGGGGEGEERHTIDSGQDFS